jgi:hypothetical protein
MNALADREVVELLHDRPDLLAVADAVAATQERSRTAHRALVPALAVAAAVVLLLVAPWQSRGPSVVDRALAAVGSGPVIHAVIEYSWPQDVVVNLATGAERERVHRQELWYDEQHHALRDSLSTDGGASVDYVARNSPDERLDPALTGFASDYREALAADRARVVGETDVDGRPAKTIEFAPRSGGAVERVDVDATTYAPLRFSETYPPDGRRSPPFRVTTIESVPYDASLFAPTASAPRPDVGEVSEAKPISLREAARALGAAPLGLGRSPGSVEVSHTKAWLTDGTKLEGLIVRLSYGRVRVSLARDRAGSYGIGFGEGEFPTPPSGSVAVTGNDSEGWQGELRQDGFAVMVNAPTKAQVVAAAGALAPLG